MKKSRTTFLILHYKELDLTVKCIELIKKLEGNIDFKIVVVDNGSNNKSGEKLKQLYFSDNRIVVLILSENKGFSRGNNYGYTYIKSNIESDFLVVLNSDVFIYQKDFIVKLTKIYEEENFVIAGPDVLAVQIYHHENPYRLELFDAIETKKQIEKYEKMFNEEIPSRILIIEVLKRLGVYNIYRRYFKAPFQSHSHSQQDFTRRHNIVLHGSCLIFSRLFIQSQNNLFSPETYLYVEEDILAFRAKENGWKTVYIPEMKVLHQQSGSTGIKILTIKNKLKSMYKQRAESWKVYEKFLGQHTS